MAALGTNKLTLLIDGVERAAEVSTVEIEVSDTESDFISFADAAAGGGKVYNLHVVGVQDPGDPESIWDLVWEESGSTVPVIVRPYGNAAASATQPHFTGDVVISMPDGVVLGGEADPSESNRFTFEASWEFVEKPAKVTT